MSAYIQVKLEGVLAPRKLGVGTVHQDLRVLIDIESGDEPLVDSLGFERAGQNLVRKVAPTLLGTSLSHVACIFDALEDPDEGNFFEVLRLDRLQVELHSLGLARLGHQGFRLVAGWRLLIRASLDHVEHGTVFGRCCFNGIAVCSLQSGAVL